MPLEADWLAGEQAASASGSVAARAILLSFIRMGLRDWGVRLLANVG